MKGYKLKKLLSLQRVGPALILSFVLLIMLAFAVTGFTGFPPALSLKTTAVFADELLTEHPPLLVDDANLLNPAEQDELIYYLGNISRLHDFDVVVVTVDSLGEISPDLFADDYFDDKGYGAGGDRDGILLLLSMEERDWAISASGYGMSVFAEYEMSEIRDRILPHLSQGEYLKAFQVYAERVDYFLAYAKSGDKTPGGDGSGHGPDDLNVSVKGGFEWWSSPRLLGALGIGLLIALIYSFSLKSKLKSVRMQKYAQSYLKGYRIDPVQSREIYLYSTVTRTKRSDDSSSSGRSGGGGGFSSGRTSSSGRSHSGMSGKF